MKNLLGLLFITFIFSCQFKKVSKVDIVNSNNYPISVTIQANNISSTFSSVPAHDKMQVEFDWSALNKEEGQFIFWIKNDLTGGKDSFSHGFIRHGELYNYIYLDAKGDQLKVEISN